MWTKMSKGSGMDPSGRERGTLPTYALVNTRDSRKSRQKTVKNTAHFCENRKNHGKITAPYSC